MMLKNPLIFALDVDTEKEVQYFLDQVSDLVGAVKLGPRLTYRYGSKLVTQCSEKTPVFIDNKYFDIPSTMKAAVQASFDSGATLVTVHALSGEEALHELAQLEEQLNKQRPFKILAVTILTSWTEKNYPSVMQNKPMTEHVLSLAAMVHKSGLTGLVCSAHELEVLKPLKSLYKVTPGIRTQSEASSADQDQKRVMSAQQALDSGAQALVIGRPILNAKNPRDYVLSLLHEIKES